MDEKSERGKKLKLEHGRPKDISCREEKEVRVYDLLDKLEISFERIDHEHLDTMADCVEVDELLEAVICKNLFLCNSQKTKFYLLMLVGEKKFKTKDISKQIESPRLSFASAEYMEEYLDILPGSVSVMGLMNDKEHKVQLLIDEELIKSDYFGCHPCVNTSSLKIKISDLLEKFLPAVEHNPIYVKVE